MRKNPLTIIILFDGGSIKFLMIMFLNVRLQFQSGRSFSASFDKHRN